MAWKHERERKELAGAALHGPNQALKARTAAEPV